jgi:hypothetical protein
MSQLVPELRLIDRDWSLRSEAREARHVCRGCDFRGLRVFDVIDRVADSDGDELIQGFSKPPLVVGVPGVGPEADPLAAEEVPQLVHDAVLGARGPPL